MTRRPTFTGAPVRLAMVGDGALRDELERLAAGLRLDQSRFLGYWNDLEAILSGTDIAVFTSANKGTPVSLIEAGAAVLPATATAVGGVREVMLPESGIVVQPDDEAGLAHAIRELACDKPLRKQMGERARAHVRRHFSSSRLLEDMDHLYAALVAAQAGRTSRKGPS